VYTEFIYKTTLTKRNNNECLPNNIETYTQILFTKLYKLNETLTNAFKSVTREQ